MTEDEPKIGFLSADEPAGHVSPAAFALWPHQAGAIEFSRSNPGALWDMWMGTGKTFSAIRLLEELEKKLIIVVAPLSVVQVWPGQLAKFETRGARVLALDDTSGTCKVKAEKVLAAVERAGNVPLFVILNYDSAWRAPLGDLLMRIPWDAVILDECHRIKSPRGAASKFIGRLASRAPLRVGLTGTPMPQSPLDIWAQARALVPNVFGQSFVRFRNEFAVVDNSAGFPKIRGFRDREKLARLMATFVYSVGRNVLKLPPVLHEQVPIRLAGESKRAYVELENTMRTLVAGGSVTPANGLVQLLRLQQMTGGSVSVETEDWSGVHAVRRVGEEKKLALVDLLEALPADEPVVVFARFREDLAMIHEAFAVLERKSLELSGARHELAKWQAGEAPGLAVQIQAGGIGVDMTRAAYCVFFSLGFSLGEYEQACARVHRPGQTRSTHYYHLVARDTVDEAVYGALRAKRDVVESVIAAMKRQKEEEPCTTNL